METILEGDVKRFGKGMKEGAKSFIVIDVKRTSDGQFDTVTIWTAAGSGLPEGIKVGFKYKGLVSNFTQTVNEVKRL